MDFPDWTVPANVTNSQLDVNITNSALDVTIVDSTTVLEVTGNVNVTNSVLDVNVTNSTFDVNIINSTLDVNVTNSSINVEIQGTANVEIQNAEVNVQNVREQVRDVSHLAPFADESSVPSNSTGNIIPFQNVYGKTVYLEYLTATIAIPSSAAPKDDLSPTATHITFKIQTSSGITLFQLNANGQMFLNLDPALPIPDGGKIVVELENRSSISLYLRVAGVVRRI